MQQLFKPRKWRASALGILLPALCLPQVGCAATPDGHAAQGGSANATHTASMDLQWGKTPFGPEASPVNGDFTSGGHITYIRFPAGMTTPLHTHSADYVGIVVTGSTRHWLPGQPETRKLLPPGSHWFIPANVEHVSECLPGAECIMAIYQQQPFDFQPIEQASDIKPMGGRPSSE